MLTNVRFDDVVHLVRAMNRKTGWTMCGEGFIHVEPWGFDDTWVGEQTDAEATCLWCLADRER